MNPTSDSTGNQADIVIDFDTTRNVELLRRQNQELELRYKALNERFSYMQRATQDAIWDWDLTTNTGWYSEGLRALYGYDPVNIGDGVEFWYANIHPDDQARIVNGIHAVVDNGGKHWADRYRFRKADGTYTWILDRGYCIHDAYGKPIRMVGSMQDINKEVVAGEALREREDSLRLVIESARLGTWNMDPQTHALQWDARCKELFGLEADAEVNYEVFLQGLHPEDRDRVSESVRSALDINSNGWFDIEYRTIGIKDQRLRWIKASGRCYFNENRLPYRYTGTVIDISDQKHREELLREQENRFRTLATAIPQIVWTTDKNGIVDYISDRWEFYTGEKPDYSFHSFQTLMHPHDREQIIPNWMACLSNGTSLRCEYRLLDTRSGSYRWFECTTVPVKDSNGEITKWIGSATDIHDKKMVEEDLARRVADRTRELSQLNLQLEKSNSELEQYAYVASHDLKEPLRKIQYYNNLLISRFGSELAAPVMEYISRSQSSAIRMSDLIQDLLDFSRLSVITPAERVDVGEVVSKIIADFDLLTADNQVSFKLGPLPVINGIKMQIHQLFSNLIGNAVKFSKSGLPNTIAISSGDVSEEEVHQYRLDAGRSYVKIIVKDNGIGFDPTYREQIFTMFQRLNDRSRYEGHGIGLALCRKIVDNHYGHIFATSQEGGGAEFTIILRA